MADDNTQDYKGYKHAAQDDNSEETATSNQSMAPHLTGTDTSSDPGADSPAVPNDTGIDTGITEADEIAMGLRTPDGKPVEIGDASNQLDPESEGKRGGDDEAANNPGVQDGTDAAPGNRPTASAVKDPEDWTTGDEPATAAQLSYISTMAVEAHEEVPTELTKAEASEKINELQKKTGRDPSSERP